MSTKRIARPLAPETSGPKLVAMPRITLVQGDITAQDVEAYLAHQPAAPRAPSAEPRAAEPPEPPTVFDCSSSLHAPSRTKPSAAAKRPGIKRER